MTLQHITLIAAAGLLLAACGQRDSTADAGAERMSRHGQKHGAGGGMMMDREAMKRMCPMRVPGATVAVEDIDGGVAIAFRSEQADQVDELRERVRRMSERHQTMRERRAKRQSGRDGGGMMMPPTTRTVEEIPQGARMVLRPEDAGDLEDLRRRCRMHAKRMQEGCPMMRMMGSAGDDDDGDAAAGESEAGDKRKQHH